jgi:D-alanyl-lipoteichoic acid acyltransferase DltB (MBOAT superfamily)
MTVCYREAVVAYVVVNGLVFAFVMALDSATQNLPNKTQHRWRWSGVAMMAVIGVYCWRFDINYGWFFLRLINYLWEYGSGRINQPNLAGFVVWCGLPFTNYGPIVRYHQFEAQLSDRVLADQGNEFFSPAWRRNLLQATGKILVAALLTGIHLRLARMADSGVYWPKLIRAFGTGPWSFYLIWAGYWHLMECFAIGWGVRLPPSFNRPFGRPNISELWANWNISATSIFREYLFYNSWGLRTINVYVNTLIVFITIGLWHGLNWYWGLWGLMHGLGFCVFLWYRRHFVRQRVGKLDPPRAGTRMIGAVLTYLFFCSCFVVPFQVIKLGSALWR